MTSSRQQQLLYTPALDGLRALAVIAVVLYHSDSAGVRGGFLGVEVFFVISGYLITSLLLAEWRHSGTIDVAGFWFRRARRLLPALFFMLLAALTFAVVFHSDEVATLRQDALAAMGYISNWYLIFDHQPYFTTFARPSLLRHLWSLAVEEQFYVVWPLLLAFLLKLCRPRYAVVLICIGAVASAVLMAYLYQPGADNSRIYYGTDTRLTGLLIGAALAFVLVPGGAPLPWTGLRAVALECAGVLALMALVPFHFRLDESGSELYRGGFALTGVETALLIASVVQTKSRLSRILSIAPLRWVGLRSYGIYLWHWPVFMLTRPHEDVALDGLSLLALRIGITLALGELSYRLVETPVRSGVVGRAWSSFRTQLRAAGWSRGVYYSPAAVGVLAAVATFGIFVGLAEPSEPPPYLAVERIQTGIFGSNSHQTAVQRRPSAIATPTPTPAPAVSSISLVVPIGAPSAPAPTSQPPVHVSAEAALAIGDSVMLGAVPQLTDNIDGISVDAREGRQVYSGIDILQAWRDAGLLGDTVIVHLGDNGAFTDGQFDEIMEVLAGVRLVVFINNTVPRDWQDPNNEVIAAGIARYSTTALVDWHSASVNNPDLLYSDGIHLRPEGAQLYSYLIAATVAAHLPPVPSPPSPEPSTAPPPPPTENASPSPIATPPESTPITPSPVPSPIPVPTSTPGESGTPAP